MTRRVKTHIKLGIPSVSPFNQSPRCPHEETLRPEVPIAKFRGISPRNVAECLREMSRSFSANFRGVSPRNFAEKTLGEISDFYFSPRKKLFPSLPYEAPHDKTNKMACAPSEESDQPGHPPSLIRVFAVRMKKAWVLR